MRWTEAIIEDLLLEETRELTGPDGKPISVRMFAMSWVPFDAVLIHGAYTEAELVEWAYNWMAVEPVSFVDAFRGIMAHLQNEILRIEELRLAGLD